MNDLTYCEHANTFFISSSHGIGCGIAERSSVRVCRDCGKIIISAEINGVCFNREFHIHSREVLEVMQKWVVFVEDAS